LFTSRTVTGKGNFARGGKKEGEKDMAKECAGFVEKNPPSAFRPSW